MQFSLASLSTAAAAILFAGQVAASAPEDPYASCNCPQNCGFTVGHECQWTETVAINSWVVSGTCVEDAYGKLMCSK
ncbi:hypothetical protein HDZ31DRAFT_60738 [Schizophyllum fasciatum]